MGSTSILDTDFNEWDTIIHEYGHAVAQDAGFYVQTANFEHFLNVNLRTLHTYDYGVLQLAFSEGWADFYSVLAQHEDGVSSPAVVPPKSNSTAGDDKYWGRPIESGQSFGHDHEMAVARILWDLYDPANEATDRIALGIDPLFGLLVDFDVSTLSELWAALRVFDGNDPQRMFDYGAIFEAHRAAPTNLGLTTGTVPTFSWDIPQGSGSVGDVLSHFVIRIFDDNLNEIYDSQLLIPDINVTVNGARRASWIMPAADWTTIQNTPGTKHWVVSGAESFTASGFTEFYWSSDRTF